MGSITLVTGGARSGKSSFAQELAMRYSGIRIFIATAIGIDEEMDLRISRHRKERGDRFETVESPWDLARAVDGLPMETEVALIDCLTVWLGNLMYRHEKEPSAVESAIDSFIEKAAAARPDLIIVTNEVGMGIVPENDLARRFRDIAGSLNRRIAGMASRVFLCVCGIPVTIKGDQFS